MFNGFSELSITVSTLPVYFKQRDKLFYPAWVFLMPILLLRIPYSLVEATLWSCMAYWVTGLAPDVSGLFICSGSEYMYSVCSVL